VVLGFGGGECGVGGWCWCVVGWGGVWLGFFGLVGVLFCGVLGFVVLFCLGCCLCWLGFCFVVWGWVCWVGFGEGFGLVVVSVL